MTDDENMHGAPGPLSGDALALVKAARGAGIDGPPAGAKARVRGAVALALAGGAVVGASSAAGAQAAGSAATASVAAKVATAAATSSATASGVASAGVVTAGTAVTGTAAVSSAAAGTGAAVGLSARPSAFSVVWRRRWPSRRSRSRRSAV
jgi:hypothetical protein